MINRRILKNTLALYARQVLIIIVNLYALRVVLNVLGVDDYGVYSVVAGVVTLCSFLPATMASATQRFFSFALGQGDSEKLRKIFSANWLLYAVIGLLSLALLESLGLWFFNERLVLSAERVVAAQRLYHVTVLSFVASIYSSPFMAIIIAHEDMHIYAYVSIAEALMKLVVVFVLLYLPLDKLELYGYLLFVVAVVNMVLYVGVCANRYAECQFKEVFWDGDLVREIIVFTGWTLFGQLTTVFRNQAVTILLNQMFNPAIVAARAVAMTVAGQVIVFSNNFNTGLYPSIIKSYATNQKEEMFLLVFNGSKLTFFLMWVFALPMLLEMETILRIWLRTVPADAVLFTQLALVEALLLSLSLPIATAARAPGNMKLYELTLGAVQIAIFVFSMIVVRLGGVPSSVFVVAIVANVLMFAMRLVIVNHLCDLPVVKYLKQVVWPIVLVFVFSALPSVLIKALLPLSLLASLVMIFISALFSCLSMYLFGLDRVWRQRIHALVRQKIVRLGRGR